MSMATLRLFSVFFDKYYWQTAVLIAKNGIARQYRNSFFGMMWTLFQPLTMVFIYTLIMPLIMKSRMPNYPLYMVASLPLWSFFNVSLYGASLSLLNNGETLKRCMVSSTVFPVADVLRNTYTFFISLFIMYAVAMLFYGPPHMSILLFPLFFLPVLMTVGALCIGIAFIAPFVRDIGDLIFVCMNMLFWLTPVLYPIDALPLFAQKLMVWNPFYIMIHPIQELVYDGTIPGMAEMFRLLGLTVISVAFGLGFYKLCRRNYVYYL